MDTETPTKEPASPSFPLRQEPEVARGRSPIIPVVAFLIVGATSLTGAYKSGRLNRFFHNAKPSAQLLPAAPHAAPTAPVPPLKPGAFVVTSISLGRPSIAIINGISHMEGDPLKAPGVTGWKVKRIVDGGIWLQNGAAVASIPLTLPGLKPLDDQLHPLN